MEELSAAQPEIRGEVSELALLFDISQTLDRTMDLSGELGSVLTAIAKHTGMLRGTLTLLNRDTGEISIEIAHGLSEKQLERGRYKPGEGVTGMVVQTGRPIVVPRISEEPTFLNRTRARNLSKGDISFICVPIKIGNEVIGTLSVDRLFEGSVSLEEDGRLLSIIASMVAQAVRLRREAQEERQRLIEENLRLNEELRERFRPANIIGNSSAMQTVFNLIAQVAKSDATVLIRGESGVGKELVAHAIHYNSLRANKPFIRVNCAALPESVIESELFGHEKGAFTGAVTQRKGRFELAQGGTIFLDEIGDLSPGTQIRLLRVLQEREFERVGGSETIRVDVRVVTATNRDLEELMRKWQFRQDLYYRLNVFPIHIPPLRERRTDILLLADYFVEKYSKANNKNVRRISTSAIDMLTRYHWPGNVRELENVIRRGVVLCRTSTVTPADLPPKMAPNSRPVMLPDGQILPLKAAMRKWERQLILDGLKATGGNRKEAAKQLKINRTTLYNKMREHEISD